MEYAGSIPAPGANNRGVDMTRGTFVEVKQASESGPIWCSESLDHQTSTICRNRNEYLDLKYGERVLKQVKFLSVIKFPGGEIGRRITLLM